MSEPRRARRRRTRLWFVFYTVVLLAIAGVSVATQPVVGRRHDPRDRGRLRALHARDVAQALSAQRARSSTLRGRPRASPRSRRPRGRGRRTSVRARSGGRPRRAPRARRKGRAAITRSGRQLCGRRSDSSRSIAAGLGADPAEHLPQRTPRARAASRCRCHRGRRDCRPPSASARASRRTRRPPCRLRAPCRAP